MKTIEKYEGVVTDLDRKTAQRIGVVRFFNRMIALGYVVKVHGSDRLDSETYLGVALYRDGTAVGFACWAITRLTGGYYAKADASDAGRESVMSAIHPRGFGYSTIREAVAKRSELKREALSALEALVL